MASALKFCALALLPAADGLAKGRVARVGLRVDDSVKAAAWYKDQFGLETAACGPHCDVLFQDGFSLRMLADGASSTYRADALSVYGVTLEMPRAQLDAWCAASSLPPKELGLIASMVPDEDPYKETKIQQAETVDAAGYRVYCVSTTADAVKAPAPKIVLVVSDLEASIKFYTEAFGLRLLRKRALLPHQAALFGILGYSEEADATLLSSPEGADSLASPRIELRYIYNNERVDSGVGLEDITFLAEDPASVALAVPALGGNVTSVAGNVAKLVDPDGYKINVCAEIADLD
ncbi:hypothetical protein M885DRAFT_613830 [Pelagophyceae sp. CCMP2097]|nr:hypothetical protein M885DRAFT_613830 [Pelagophyceae sp. CCMP2097]